MSGNAMRLFDVWGTTGAVVSVEREYAIAPGSSVAASQTSDSAWAKVAETFKALADAWKAQTEFCSAVSQMVLNENYQKIIGLGPGAIPSILERLKQGGPDHWYWALGAITGENPARDVPPGDIRAICNAWLAWGRRRGFVR